MASAEQNKAQDIITDFERIKGNRSNWESHWDEIARYMSPLDEEFFVRRTPGEKRRTRIYDDTAQISLDRFSAFMDSIHTPRDQKYQKIQADIPELNKIHSVKVFFDAVTDQVFKLRYNPRGNFASQMFEVWKSIGMFGTGGMMINDSPAHGALYKSIHLSEMYIVENGVGLIDVVYRPFELTAKQAKERFGEENLPEKIHTALGKNRQEKFEFIQYIRPNPNFNPDSIMPIHRKYKSDVLAREDRAIVHEGGFSTFPIPIARAATSPQEVYGRGPGVMMLSTIKMLNQMKKTNIRAGHMAVDPPKLMRDDGAVKIVDLRAGRAVVGGLDMEGNPTIVPYNDGVNVPMGEELMAIERENIEKAFLVDLFLMARDNEMTATEILHRAQERSSLLSSFTGRQESEFLVPLVEREMDILERMGKIPPMPPELIEAEGEWEAIYTGPMAKARKAEEAIGSEQVVRAAMELSNFQPEVLDNLDGDAWLQIVSDAGGAGSTLLRDPAIVQEIREERSEAEAEQQELEKAKLASEAGVNTAKVGELTGGVT